MECKASKTKIDNLLNDNHYLKRDLQTEKDSNIILNNKLINLENASRKR